MGQLPLSHNQGIKYPAKASGLLLSKVHGGSFTQYCDSLYIWGTEKYSLLMFFQTEIELVYSFVPIY